MEIIVALVLIDILLAIISARLDQKLNSDYSIKVYLDQLPKLCKSLYDNIYKGGKQTLNNHKC